MSWTPEGLRTDAQVYSGLEFIPLKVSRQNTWGFGQRGCAHPVHDRLGLAPPVQNSSQSGTLLCVSTRSGTPRTQLKFWSGWSDQNCLGSRTSFCVLLHRFTPPPPPPPNYPLNLTSFWGENLTRVTTAHLYRINWRILRLAHRSLANSGT